MIIVVYYYVLRSLSDIYIPWIQLMIDYFWQHHKTTYKDSLGKNKNTFTLQAEFSKFASVLFDQRFQI